MAYVTHAELEAAISALREDIVDTENRLRTEFTSAVRYEGDRTDRHLATQDGQIRWILRTAITSLVLIACALIYLVR